MRFADRPEAGRALAARLTPYANRDDVVVFGLARGGVPVAAEVARALGAPLDVLLVRKLGAPDQPELAIGAIAEDGVALINEDVMRGLGLGPDAIDRATVQERPELDRRLAAYRGGRPGVAVDGRVAIVVDDGLATGASMEAACRTLAARGAARLVVAVPVASRDACDRLRTVAHEVIAVVRLREIDEPGAHCVERRRRALAVLLSGLPTLAAVAEPAAPAPATRSATPIADAARRGTNRGYWQHDDNAALMWTGFGLVAGGGSLIAGACSCSSRFASDVAGLAAALSRAAAGRPPDGRPAVCRRAFARRPDDGSGLPPRHSSRGAR